MPAPAHHRKTKEAAEAEVDRQIAINEIAATLKPGDCVKFIGSRSTRWNQKAYREVLEVHVEQNYTFECSYDNPDYVEWNHDYEYRWGTEEYKKAWAEYEENTTQDQRSSHLRIRKKGLCAHVTSKNMPQHGHEVVVAQNMGSYLGTVKVGEEWKNIKDLLKGG